MALKKKEKKMLILLAVVALVGGLVLWRNLTPKELDDQFNSPRSETAPTAPAATATRSSRGGGGGGGSRGGSRAGGSAATGSTHSFKEFSEHSTGNDCWVILDGQIFDITAVLKDEPGALQFCGTVGFQAGYIQNNAGLKDVFKSGGSFIGTIG